MKVCCIKDCEGPLYAKGMCSKHYRRLRDHGDPTKVKKPQLHGMTVEERFLHYTEKTEGCWNWVGSKDRRKYGRLNIKNIPVLAHRISWDLFVGPIPAEAHILHKCDNPSCVNPDHLFLGDHDANMADKMAKGRHRYGTSKGEAHGCAKLSYEQVLDIRASREVPRVVAERYRISRRQVRDIRSRKAWGHIP